MLRIDFWPIPKILSQHCLQLHRGRHHLRTLLEEGPHAMGNNALIIAVDNSKVSRAKAL